MYKYMYIYLGTGNVTISWHPKCYYFGTQILAPKMLRILAPKMLRILTP